MYFNTQFVPELALEIPFKVASMYLSHASFFFEDCLTAGAPNSYCSFLAPVQKSSIFPSNAYSF